MRAGELLALLEETPVVAAVKDEGGLRRCLECGCKVVFVLYGDVVGIPGIVEKIKAGGKAALVHVDLIDGLSPREAAVDYIAKNTAADGIITTKAALARRAQALGLAAVQRLFLLDSIALQNAQRVMEGADLIEVLPGVMPKIVRRLVASVSTPVITGGLISDKEDVVAALSAGAVAVSTTKEDVWFL